MYSRKLTSALFVDFDNIFLNLHDPFVDGIRNWLAWLEDGACSGGRERRFVKRSVFWNAHFEGYRPVFEAAGFNAFICRAEAAKKAKAMKSSADIWLTMDVIETALTWKLDEVVLLSMDTDFVPVVNRLQHREIRVVAAGDETNPTFGIYSDHADAVICRNALLSACTYVRQPRPMWEIGPRNVEVAPPLPRRSRRRERQRSDETMETGTAGADGKVLVELTRVGEALEIAGRRTPHQPISRGTIERVASQFPGFFNASGAAGWFGLGSLDAFAETLAQVRSNLAVAGQRKGVQMIYVGPVDADARSPDGAPDAEQ